MWYAHKPFILLCFITTLLTGVALQRASAQNSSPPRDEYTDVIRPIFETRCIACHSCSNAPCQLNLQSYSGAARGATSQNVYDAERLRSVSPTRLDIDAATTAGWRDKGFFDVLSASQPDASLLLRLTKLRHTHSSLQPTKPVAESQICIPDSSDRRLADKDNFAALGMPYGLPPLASEAITALQEWGERGAPGPQPANHPERNAMPATLREQVKSWESFLNGQSSRQVLVSRYLYEHLFLAHLHFAESSGRGRPQFFRLVRSRTHCDSGIDEIATRRPTDAPGTTSMSYCLRPVSTTIVEKTHIPYQLSPQKLERIRSLFLRENWKVSKTRDYDSERAKNPFETFPDIPVRSRYQFLLDDAQYHIATFIKGPVCNGSAAVNSIQEQFYVFFLKPEVDGMAMLPTFAAEAEQKLILPGDWGSDASLLRDIPFFTRIVEYRESYRRLRAASVRKLRPNGYTLDDIWDGDGDNPNALLTVFRHNDNAAVVKGAVGDLPKTIFVLDYALFERLVYNLVVNFDVFGNVGHQVMTRLYMDLIRMEAEELFLTFLPPADRRKLRSNWYQGGLLTDLKLNIVFPLTNQNEPTGITFRSNADHKLEFVERVMFERLPAAARGPADPINWRRLRTPGNAPTTAPSTSLEAAFRPMTSVRAVNATPFARYFPELSLVLVKRPGRPSKVYSIALNREHDNVSWIMGENLRLAPAENTLTIYEGILGGYPNMLFEIDEAEAREFTAIATKVTSVRSFDRLIDRFGVRRSSERFWQVYDEINATAINNQPVERGVLDLTRYDLHQR